jgi:VanZ family protein
LANSTVNDSWTGQIFGLAIYHTQLRPDQVRRHYDVWTTKQAPISVNTDRPIAVYRFNERAGNVIRNQLGGGPDLMIPPHYTVLYPTFLLSAWRSHLLTWSHWQDIGINVAGFIPFGLSFRGFLSTARRYRWPATATLALGALLSLTIEFLQTFLPTRDSDATDLISNLLGTVIGMLAYRFSEKRGLVAHIGC